MPSNSNGTYTLDESDMCPDADVLELVVPVAPKGLHKGGEGSGNFGHEGRPGEVGGSAPGGDNVGLVSPDRVGSATQGYLLMYQKASGTEQGAIVDGTGKVVSDGVQSESRKVGFQSEYLAMMKDDPNSTLVHTHPTDNSFSLEDVKIGLRYGVPNQQVVTDHYVFKITASHTFDSAKLASFDTDWREVSGATVGKWADAANNIYAAAEAGWSHEINLKMATRYGYGYAREAR